MWAHDHNKICFFNQIKYEMVPLMDDEHTAATLNKKTSSTSSIYHQVDVDTNQPSPTLNEPKQASRRDSRLGKIQSQQRPFSPPSGSLLQVHEAWNLIFMHLSTVRSHYKTIFGKTPTSQHKQLALSIEECDEDAANAFQSLFRLLAQESHALQKEGKAEEGEMDIWTPGPCIEYFLRNDILGSLIDFVTDDVGGLVGGDVPRGLARLVTGLAAGLAKEMPPAFFFWESVNQPFQKLFRTLPKIYRNAGSRIEGVVDALIENLTTRILQYPPLWTILNLKNSSACQLVDLFIDRMENERIRQCLLALCKLTPVQEGISAGDDSIYVAVLLRIMSAFTGLMMLGEENNGLYGGGGEKNGEPQQKQTLAECQQWFCFADVLVSHLEDSSAFAELFRDRFVRTLLVGAIRDSGMGARRKDANTAERPTSPESNESISSEKKLTFIVNPATASRWLGILDALLEPIQAPELIYPIVRTFVRETYITQPEILQRFWTGNVGVKMALLRLLSRIITKALDLLQSSQPRHPLQPWPLEEPAMEEEAKDHLDHCESLFGIFQKIPMEPSGNGMSSIYRRHLLWAERSISISQQVVMNEKGMVQTVRDFLLNDMGNWWDQMPAINARLASTLITLAAIPDPRWFRLGLLRRIQAISAALFEDLARRTGPSGVSREVRNHLASMANCLPKVEAHFFPVPTRSDPLAVLEFWAADRGTVGAKAAALNILLLGHVILRISAMVQVHCSRPCMAILYR